MEREDEVRPGWLPPKAPVPGAWEPPRTAYGAVRTQPPVEPRPAPSAAARVSIALGAIALILLVMTVGVGYPLCGLLSAIALFLGIRSRRRPAIVLAGVGLGLALAAAVTWGILEANGFTPEDLQRWLEDQVERRRSSAGG